ncbi:hypothetical protein ACFVZH_09560 [Streptomyces sp. NPDC059534]|uniref:hypothetical protein n=1 Tax=Streptomyces sp. NPDC059534 TaxID=3346859 RepID=UPI0036C1D85C
MYELAILARGGILLTARAVATGWPPGRLAARLRRDGWQRICRGAWAAPGKEVDWRVHAAALQHLRPDLVCSHGTAAHLHRIEQLGTDGPPDLLHFTAPPPARPTRDHRLRLHTTTHLTDRDHTTRRGLRTTTPARTVADLIRSSRTREEAVVTADSALASRAVDGVRRGALLRYDDLAAELTTRRPGSTRARAWLPWAEPSSGSPAETVARLRIRDAGLIPESQPTLHTPDGRPLRPDFLFRPAGLAVEIEGYAFHGTRRAHERDIARFNALQSCPDIRRVLRFTATEVFHHPHRMTTTILAALAALSR